MARKSISKYMDEYAAQLGLEKKFSPHTYRAQLVDLKRLCTYFNDDLRTLHSQSWEAYCAHLQRKYKARTIARAYSTYRQFFEFCAEKKGYQFLEKLEFPRVRLPSRLPKVLSYDEVSEVLKDSSDISDLLELLYATGARISEACELEWRQIDFSRKVIRLHGKGRKMREVPLAKYLIPMLKKRKKLKSRYVFPSKKSLGKPVTPRSVRYELKKITKHKTRYPHLHPHLFRHSIATHLLDQGAGLRFIQELLGHKTLSTTQKYLSISKQRLLETYDRTHPRS